MPRIYRFVQWELPWALGPDDGRYVLREHAGEDPHHVLVLATVRPPRPAAKRRARDVAPEPDAAPPPITRATLVDAATIEEDEAHAWLADATGENADANQQQALAWLNHALRCQRAAAADPYVKEVEPRQALVTRVGYGRGEQVADGRWEEARELPRERPVSIYRRRRESALRPQERLAALLAGRDAVLACEELALRARLDLDHGHTREAALQAHLALEAAVVELQAYRDTSSLAKRVDELEAHRDSLSAAANEALQGGLTEPTAEVVAAALERVEAALRARSATALY